MNTLAVIGAGGFIGGRLVETCVLDGQPPVRAVVRAARSLGRLCRFGTAFETRLADAENPAALTEALRGCRTAVNAVTGATATITRSIRSIHAACRAAGVERLIHLSSATVFGQVLAADTADDTPPVRDHWMPYARAKIEAEHFLRGVDGASPAISVLRPGLVWGPRSTWSWDAARSLRDGTAVLVGDGQGVCNTIYVDNLIACILACHHHDGDPSGFFNVADAEAVTWRQFYVELAGRLGWTADARSVDRFRPTLGTWWGEMRSRPWYEWLKARLPEPTRLALKAGLTRWRQLGGAAATRRAGATPRVTREMWQLQTVRHRLPSEKFARHFAFTPPVPFPEGMGRTAAWLRFAGLGRDATMH